MIVPYTELPDDAGGWPRPLLDLAVGDMDEVRYPCLVDSGALHTLLPRWLADAAGVPLRKLPKKQFGVGGTTTEAALTAVRLSTEAFAWEAEVGFCHPWPYGWGLLGQQSFFRYFTVVFRAADFEFELTPLDA